MRIPSIRESWLLIVIAISLLGTNGCPVQAGCGVSGGMPGSPQGFGAQSWTCQASVQIAKGATISSPGPVKQELLAKKESSAVQVASLRQALGQAEERGFGFAGTDRRDELTRKITELSGETDRLDQQLKQLDSLQVPPATVQLEDGTWTVEGDRVTFHSQSPYIPGREITIPYIIRSEQGDILETGFLPVGSIRLNKQP